MDLNEFGKIGVLMGGSSSERAISLKSGIAVYESLRKENLDAVAIDIQTDDTVFCRQLLKQSGIDVAFVALHGRFGEDGGIQALLEEQGIPYTGSGPQASLLAMDKVASHKIFAKAGIPIPSCVVVSLSQDKSLDLSHIGLEAPFVVKPARQGSSIGLSIVGKEELKEAIEYASGFDKQVIVEEYIPGREITVGILGHEALSIVEIISQNKFYDYQAKYEPGKSSYVVPADLSDEISRQAQCIAQEAHKSLGCFGFSRVDMRLSPDNRLFVLEVNSIPGLTETSLLPKAAKVSGLSFVQLCIRILNLSYSHWQTTEF